MRSRGADTMAEMLQEWLRYYDPIHRGWTPAGIAHGVCATNGFSFPRIRGGYVLRRSVGGAAGGSGEVVAAAGAEAAAVRTFPWVRHEAGADYTYRLTAINGGGIENLQEVSAARAVFDGSGRWLGPRPNAPADLRVTPIRGGRFRVRWTYSPKGQEVEPAEFRVYCGVGWSGVDYGSAAGRVAYDGDRVHFGYASEPFADGTRVTWAVRAVSAAGREEDNALSATGWADALPPAARPTVIVGRV